MATISELPDELLLLIVDYLDISVLRDLVTVNSHFHELLVPSLFMGVRATNREGDAGILKEVASKYGKHIQKLYFDLYLLGNSPGDHDHGESITTTQQERYRCDNVNGNDCCLPETAQKLLSGQLLPNVTTIEIAFDFDFDEGIGDDAGDAENHYEYGGPGLFSVLDLGESEADFLEKEHDFHWRTALRDAIAALASNAAIRNLQLRDLVPKGTSAYLTPQWRGFLSQLQTLDIEIWGGADEGEWQASTANGFHDFIAWQSRFFFDNLTAIRHLRFAASPQCPVGGQGHLHLPLPISASDLPKVKDIRFENIFLDTPLLNFLRAKSKQLVSLTFKHCLSLGQPEDYSISPDRVPWSTLFSTIRTHNTALRDLVVEDEPHARRLAEGYDIWGCEIGKETKGAKAAQEELDRGGRRVFMYGGFDEKYGYVLGLEEYNLSCFLEGADQREWDLVSEAVEQNMKQLRDSSVPAA